MEKQRKRRLGGERAKLSNWHFGSKISAKKLYDIKEVNARADQFIKRRDPKDAEFLVTAFNNYLMKYVKLLTTGRMSPEGNNTYRIPRDTHRFLSSFVKGKASKQQLVQAAARLPNSFIHMDADDIYNELVIIFLELLDKFYGKGGFTGYIYYRFGWAVKARMTQEQKNPLNYQPLYDDIEDHDRDGDFYGTGIHTAEANDSGGLHVEGDVWKQDSENPQTYHFIPVTLDIPHLSPKFITQPSEPFDTIWTKIQRSIMVMKFADEMSDSAIASKLGLGNGSNVRKLYKEAIEAYHHLLEID